MRIQGFIDEPRLVGDRRLAQRPTFLSSKAHRRLMDDLGRYCRGEILGRSYLITGYRGAGKTAVTRRAVEDLYYAELQGSLQHDTLPAGPRPLQRPLLVKLNGPSLLAHDPPATRPPQPAARMSAAERKRKAEEAVDDKLPELDEDAPKDPTLLAPYETLKQVAVQLYRALADEISTTFAVKAKGYAARRGFNGEELAAQLKLELDAGADPAGLRDYWRRIGRLDAGVLWPLSVDAAMAKSNVTDQGLREIVAVATAGQAFQACTGKLEDSREDTQSLNREAQVKAQGATDVKELVGRIGALGVGGLTSAALWGQNPVAAVSGGILVWLIGTLSVGWSFTDTRKRDQVVKYTFLKDRTIQTLDRDLPVIMERVRDAGLAPIFIIDELDKVENPETFVKRVIERLKPIIVDTGFFIFLADRRYYDLIETKVRKEPFGVEHTYFSERRLLAYSPDEYEAYLRETIVHDGNPSPTDELARTILVLHLTHRARLNFTSLNRALAHLTDEGLVERPATTILSRSQLVLGAAVQLAIDIVLREGDLPARMVDDPGFTQLVYDTLYAISNAWEKDEAGYDTRRDALATYLAGRADDIAPADITLLLRAQDRLVELLSSFEALAAAVGAQVTPPPQEPGAWAAILQQAPEISRLARSLGNAPGVGLLAPDPGRPGWVRFVFDMFGRDMGKVHPGAEAAPAPPRRGRAGRGKAKTAPSEADHLVDLINAFGDLLTFLDVELTDLSRARLLPDTLDWQTLLDARRQLAPDSGASAADVRQALRKAREFSEALQQQGARLSAGLVLAQKLRLAAAASPPFPLRDALAAIARYPVLGLSAAGAPWTLSRWPQRTTFAVDLRIRPLASAAPGALRAFAAALDGVTLPASEAAKIQAERQNLWTAWRQRLGRYFDARPDPSQTYTFGDLLSAMEGVGPSAWLRADLDSLHVADWSRFCLEALGGDSGRPLRWAVVAALRALRFEAKLLRRVAEDPAPPPPLQTPSAEARSQALSMAEGAPRGHRGILIIVSDDLDASADTLSGRTAQLMVRYSDFRVFQVGLAWLRDLDAFDGVSDEFRPS